MARGSKDKYTDKQKRKAAHIEESYEARGVPREEAEARAWATVNKQSGGGERKGGSGQDTSPQKKAAARKSSARHAVATRRGTPRPGSTLESMTRQELMELARKRDIRGRSTMRKAELLEALR
ncbi:MULTISPECIES: Rho termination factor N-terminal domain-containing protein [unclassified Pseudomonas]|uniref:Rho termination factor N-terminal domain-containing protein n=1 Tax=unclassified Pseudomonas TaxID=196821 RepID=UPI002447CCA9|nr:MULTISPECIES: Rho termination factor N-terminal domain-containing protein [unclassified Pseudomonas]MDG9930107.1 Rho termination factor N-terminal domain-containing protein [Pseudomonas sp. GD04042]MDH0483491.1 Rho termination factor N-terminal domain-containing protein [Pseudomonas sp. GD04015]MDH0605487.1 Rho termination factor N-terminal domain-containing protein [Pseudomonas sp. GD03869]